MLVSRLTHADAARLVVRRRLPALCLPLLVCTFGPIYSRPPPRAAGREWEPSCSRNQTHAGNVILTTCADFRLGQNAKRGLPKELHAKEKNTLCEHPSASICAQHELYLGTHIGRYVKHRFRDANRSEKAGEIRGARRRDARTVGCGEGGGTF